MLPKTHAFLGLIFTIFVYYIFSITYFEAGIILFASIFIDFDHYVWYIKRQKDFNLKKAYYFLKNYPRHNKKTLMIFHTIEFITFIAILALFWNIFWFLLVGIIFHSILDFIDLIRQGLLSGREFSYINYLISNKNNYL